MDNVVRGCILSALSNVLFDVYCSAPHTAATLWETLSTKYSTDDSGVEKYQVGKYLKYRMSEGKSVTDQVHEFQIIVQALNDAGMKLPEKFVVMSIIEKFPRSWEEFGMTLKHRSGSLTLNELMSAIAIQEVHNGQGTSVPVEASANVMTANAKFKGKAKTVKTVSDDNLDKLKAKKTIQKKPKAKQSCWNCGTGGHFSRDCPSKKKPQGSAAADHSGKVNMVMGPKDDDPDASSPGVDALTSDITKYVISIPELFTVYEPNEWLVDTGANVHVCADKLLFVSYQPERGRSVTMGNASAAKVLGTGRVDLKFPNGRILTLQRVHHVPDIRRNIISGSSLVRDGFELSFKCNKVIILDSGSFVGKGYSSDGLFKIRVETDLSLSNNDSFIDYPVSYSIESSNVWHGRLGHINYDSVKRMMNLDIIPKHAIDKSSKCHVCVEAKSTRAPFKSVERNSEILDLVHSDICEFNGVLTKDKKKYFLTFIDDASRYCYVYLLNTKDEALEKFIIFKNEAETQTGKKLKRLRSDRGGEYESNPFMYYCQENGIVHEETPPYTPQSNGVAERKNRTLTDMINSLLISSGLPKYMWGEALNTACHILNRVPPKHKKESPFEPQCHLLAWLDYVLLERLKEDLLPATLGLYRNLRSTTKTFSARKNLKA